MIETIGLGILIAALSGLISLTCWNIRRLRCTSCTTPCCKIERKLMSAESMQRDPIQPPTINIKS